MKRLSFPEFQRTGEIVTLKRACELLSCDVEDWDNTPASGGINYDGLVVLRCKIDGGSLWYLQVGRSEYYELDLAVIERKLYDYAVEEGYFAEPSLDFQI